MALFRFFKQLAPRQFHLPPRYYDEHKERLRQSEERVLQQLGQAARGREYHPHPEDIRTAFRESLDRTRAEKKSKMRVGLFAGVLFIICYLLVHYAG